MHLHLAVELDAANRLAADAQDTTWECLYIKLLDTPLALAPGDALECRMSADASSNTPCYQVEVHHVPGATRSPVFVGSFAWSGDGS